MYQQREFLKLAPRRSVEPDTYWLHFSRTAMTCRFEITLSTSEQSGVQAPSAVLADAETFHHAAAEIFYDHVGLFEQVSEDRAALQVFEVISFPHSRIVPVPCGKQ
jgi:hypothetical protein